MIKIATLADLPAPPEGRTGWPWTEAPPTDFPSANLPTLTVVTPSFMQGEFIEHTIRSVILQGYPRLEYFVLDGGSTDATRDVIRKYEPWLSAWRCERDTGQSATVTEGWQRGRGSILAWINSDDWYHPRAFAAVANAAIASPKQAWFMGPVDDHTMDARFIKRHLPRAMSLAELLGRKDYGYHQPGMFWRRTLLDEIGHLDPALHNSFDHDFWARSLLAGHQLEALETPVACFRKHASSKTGGNITRALREDREVFSRHHGKLPDAELRKAEDWLRTNEADYFLTSTYQLLAAKKRGAAMGQLLRHSHLIPRLPTPKLWLGALFRVAITGRPPGWFST
jgi:glycosyltransferase involved in cell wall biosynthesis